VAEFVGKSAGSLIGCHEVCPDECRAKRRCARMFRVVQRCMGTSTVMFRCTGNVRECMGTHREVLEVRLEAWEGSRDAYRYAGRFGGCTDVCREVLGCSGGVQVCTGMCGDVRGMC
jgi:hypothetical protein